MSKPVSRVLFSLQEVAAIYLWAPVAWCLQRLLPGRLSGNFMFSLFGLAPGGFTQRTGLALVRSTHRCPTSSGTISG